MLPFFPRKSIYANSKRNNIQINNNQITKIRKEPRTSSTKHKQTRTKRNSHFHTPITSFRKKSLQKSSPTTPFQKHPQNHFPKTQVHLPSNALTFSFKRQRVFPEMLRGFRPNTSAFWLQIRLFRPIFTHFLLQIHPNTRFYTGNTPSTSLLKGVTQDYTQKNAKFLHSERKQNFAF